MVGTRSFGDVDFFIPLWQDQGSLLFGDLRGTFTAQPTEEGNFGLGYRTQISPEWILGGYGYFDIANSANDNLFYQVTLGVELKSVDWDFRLNGYIPINPDGGSVNKNSNADIHINGNTIKMTTESRDEKALYGFDGEVGWRVPVFPAGGDFDIRVYAGGYYFTNGDVDTIAGLSPAVAIQQSNKAKSARSTVGTQTEIHDSLRLLFAHGTQPVGQPVAADQLTTDGKVLRWDGIPSSDGKRIAHFDKDQQLWLLDLKTRKQTRLATSTSPSEPSAAVWREMRVRYAVSNSFAFGGLNAVLVFGPPPG